MKFTKKESTHRNRFVVVTNFPTLKNCYYVFALSLCCAVAFHHVGRIVVTLYDFFIERNKHFLSSPSARFYNEIVKWA